MDYSNSQLVRLDQKKVKVIRDWIINWIQTRFINGVMKEMNVPRDVMFIVNIANNLDKIGFIQTAINQLGVYKFVAYLVYFAFIA